MALSGVVWKGDNQEELERYLSSRALRVDRSGDTLRLFGIGIDEEITIGDEVLLNEQGQVGIMRQDVVRRLPQVQWQGENIREFVAFLGEFEVDLQVLGTSLYLIVPNEEPYMVGRGDIVVRDGRTLAIKRAGVDHGV